MCEPSVVANASRIASISIALGAALTFSCFAQITTSQYDNSRTGANLQESKLTPRNVNSTQFGRLFSLRVDGDAYAQPLYLPGLQIPGKGKHDVIFVATEHDGVYAFDSEGRPATPLWRVNFTKPEKGMTTVAPQDVKCPFINPEVGITSTPVIDIATERSMFGSHEGRKPSFGLSVCAAASCARCHEWRRTFRQPG